MKKLLMLPGPTDVPERILKAVSQPMMDHRCPEFHELHERIVEGLKYAFQTRNDVYALTCSGTGGVEAAIFNVIDPGDKVVVPVGGVFAERMADEVKCVKGRLVEIRIPWNRAVKVEEVEEVLDRERDVKALALVYNETSTGVTSRDLKKMGRLTSERGVLLIVDAISILAGDELKVDEWNIDICIAGSQKCLACPPGLALISVSERAWEVIKARKTSQTHYFDLLACKRFYEERRETPFTPALPLYYALDEGLKMLKEEGLENRIARHKLCAEAFYRGFEAMKLNIFANPEVRSNTVISINYPEGILDAKFRDALRKDYGLYIAGGMGKFRGKMFRVGSMGTVGREEVLYTLSSIAKELDRQGFGVSIEGALEAAEGVFK